MSNEDIGLFTGHGVEILLKQEQDFLKIKETLTRIGVASRKENRLFQSCHILHKQGRYAIVHFKELFSLDGKKTDLSEEDIGRRNTIASLLEEWKLLTVVNPPAIVTPRAEMSLIKIIPFKEKGNWVLEAKYSIGKKK